MASYLLAQLQPHGDDLVWFIMEVDDEHSRLIATVEPSPIMHRLAIQILIVAGKELERTHGRPIFGKIVSPLELEDKVAEALADLERTLPPGAIQKQRAT